MTKMKITATNCKVTAPAGEYFVGDPCYAVPEKDWSDLLASCDYFMDSPVGTVGEHEVLAFSTAHGDGVYTGNDGRAYPVDSGMIGLTPMAMTDKPRAALERLGRIVNFECPVHASNHEDGWLVFSGIEIEMDSEPEDDGEEW